jgi:uncharacterized membrane protein
MRELDDALDPDQVPALLETTVDSARALLGAVASGTIAAASVVFSLTLVAIQLSSNAYSSRVLRTFLRDRFQQNMMGIVLATFFYSLLVLRDVRGPLADGGDANVPSASVTLATVLALAAILALLASISHTAQSVRVSHVSSSVRNDTRDVILDRLGSPRDAAPIHGRPAGRMDADGDEWVPFDVQAPGVTPSPLAVATGGRVGFSAPPGTNRCVIDADEGGWVQQISVDAILDALGGAVDGTTFVRLEVAVGTYVAAGAPLLTIWGVPSEQTEPPEQPEGGASSAATDSMTPTEPSVATGEFSEAASDTLRTAVWGAIRIGNERTMQQDIAFGLTMLEDIALRALSPGINDPNTAGAIIPQIGELLFEILVRDPPPVQLTAGGITIVRSVAPSYLDYIESAFGQIRRVSASQPAIRLTMMRTLATVASELERRGATTPSAMSALRVSMTRLIPRDGDADDPAVLAAHELLAGTARFGAQNPHE